ncbi:MAG TPA: hypothetical protein VGU63_12990 [Candidatus Acidoferrales bacterium]|nr:hypothetical protein [Candidatus Acidoferrales bacterium]
MAMETRFKSCFIAAPLGTDTSVLRRLLQANAIRWSDYTTVEPGLITATAIANAITAADFVCIILPGQAQSNVLFEAGMAYARRKPILALIGKSENLPFDLASLTYFRVEANEIEAVDYALSTFLAHASEHPLGEIRIPPSKRETFEIRPPRMSVPPTSGPGRPDFERATEKLLLEAGFIVSSPSERRSQDQGADLAVWIEDLESYSLGNPLLIEVKAGNLDQARLHLAGQQLRSYVSKTHGRSGLLIYWDSLKREFPKVQAGWPLIFQLSGEFLEKLIHEHRLAEELVRLRNNAVHGEA